MTQFDNIKEEMSIVILGSMNPAVYNPDWLLRHRLLREEDVEEDKVRLSVIHPEISRFSLSWCQLEVIPKRLVLRCSDRGYYEATRDLAIGIMTILSETPVTAIGLNMDYVASSDERESFDKLGDLLAPKDPWQEIIPGSPRHGLAQLSMQSQRGDDIPGEYNVHIKPISTENGRPGIELQVNNHYLFEQIVKADPDITPVEVIMAHWNSSLDVADHVWNKVLELAED